MKAILVTDMPIDCQHCTLVQRDYGNDYWCQFVGDLEFDEVSKIHERCPLKKMPTKNDYEGSYVEYAKVSALEAFHQGLAIGWNDCIEEIER